VKEPEESVNRPDQKQMKEIVDSMKYLKIIDFDDHFHNAKADWRNADF
jgi:hypothetical protein